MHNIIKLKAKWNNSGTVTLKAVLNADFFIRSTHEKAGTLRIDTTLDIKLTSQGRHLAGQAKLTELKLREVGGKKLGVEQDALDNLANTFVNACTLLSCV